MAAEVDPSAGCRVIAKYVDAVFFDILRIVYDPLRRATAFRLSAPIVTRHDGEEGLEHDPIWPGQIIGFDYVAGYRCTCVEERTIWFDDLSLLESWDLWALPLEYRTARFVLPPECPPKRLYRPRQITAVPDLDGLRPARRARERRSVT